MWLEDSVAWCNKCFILNFFHPLQTEYIRKFSWVILIFSGEKPFFQNNLRHIAFFFSFFFFYTFQGLWTLVICNNTNENFLWEPEKIKFKFQIMKYDAWNFTCVFLTPFLVFVHWKLKILAFLMESVLGGVGGGDYLKLYSLRSKVHPIRTK